MWFLKVNWILLIQCCFQDHSNSLKNQANSIHQFVEEFAATSLAIKFHLRAQANLLFNRLLSHSPSPKYISEVYCHSLNWIEPWKWWYVAQWASSNRKFGEWCLQKKSQSSVQSIFVRCENCKKSVNTRPKRGDRFNLIALYAYRVNSMLYCKLNFPNNLSWRYGVRELIWLP